MITIGPPMCTEWARAALATHASTSLASTQRRRLAFIQHSETERSSRIDEMLASCRRATGLICRRQSHAGEATGTRWREWRVTTRDLSRLHRPKTQKWRRNYFSFFFLKNMCGQIENKSLNIPLANQTLRSVYLFIYDFEYFFGIEMCAPIEIFGTHWTVKRMLPVNVYFAPCAVDRRWWWSRFCEISLTSWYRYFVDAFSQLADVESMRERWHWSLFPRPISIKNL